MVRYAVGMGLHLRWIVLVSGRNGGALWLVRSIHKQREKHEAPDQAREPSGPNFANRYELPFRRVSSPVRCDPVFAHFGSWFLCDSAISTCCRISRHQFRTSFSGRSTYGCELCSNS